MTSGLDVFAEKTAQAEGFTIRYLEAGSGPAVVHFHGAGGLSPSHGLAALADAHRVVTIEMPGFGREANDRTESGAEMAATLRSLLDTIGLDRVNLIGSSMGAVVALWFAVAYGDRLDTLVLEAPAAFRPERLPNELSPEELQRALFVHPERVPPRPAPDPATEERRFGLVRRLVGPDDDPGLVEAMGSVVVPTLVLFGTRDGLIPPEKGRIYKRLLPNCFLEYVYDAAHGIQHDRPEAFAAIVGEFIDRRGAFLSVNASSLVYP